MKLSEIIQGLQDIKTKHGDLDTATATTAPTPAPVPTGLVYEVGPGKRYASLGVVPFEALKAGESVHVFYRPEPYREKLFLCVSGTATAPITIKGIAGPNGERPIIDGESATTRSAYKYRYSSMDTRGLITVSQKYGDAYGYKPKHIVIEGLCLKGAHMDKRFKNVAGLEVAYAKNAAAVYVERGENITVKDCEITGSGNGVFVASGGDEQTLSRDFALTDCVIHNNGNVGSDREHNVYTECAGIVVKGNDFRPLLAGALGGQFKDRSAGTVFENNRVEGGARTLDLVDSQNAHVLLTAMPSYRTAQVNNNVLIAGNPGPSRIVQYGGDSGMPERNRKGTLHFTGNVIKVQANQSDRWRTIIFQATTNDEAINAKWNAVEVLPRTPGAVPTLTSWMETAGRLTLENNTANIPIVDWKDGGAGTGTVVRK
jgi:hypothetical protein